MAARLEITKIIHHLAVDRSQRRMVGEKATWELLSTAAEAVKVDRDAGLPGNIILDAL